MLLDLVKQNRSYRKFDESVPVGRETLLALIDTARHCPASINLQPLKFLYCNDREKNKVIFPLLAWAMLLKDYEGPGEGERPAAYIVVCTDKTIASNTGRFAMDVGIVSQTILLAAVEKGLGGCMIGNFKPEKLSAALDLPDHLEPSLVIALGKPGETIVLEELPHGEKKSAYYRDSEAVHHVPKRSLRDVAVEL